MVRSAAAGITAATMLPWVAPEVLRTPELVTGKVGLSALVLWNVLAKGYMLLGWLLQCFARTSWSLGRCVPLHMTHTVKWHDRQDHYCHCP